MKKKLLIIIVAVAILGGTFYGGMKYGQNKTPAGLAQQRFQQTGAAGAAFRNNRADGFNFVSGEIIAKDDKSITVKLRDSGSKIVFYSDTTEIGKFATGTASDLESGKTVTVNGKTNSDGSVTAQSIQIR